MWPCLVSLFLTTHIMIASPLNGNDFATIAQDTEIIKNCNSSHPVNKDELNYALFEQKFQKEVNQTFKCFLNCLHTEYGWMSRNGTFNLRNIKETLERADIPNEKKELATYICALDKGYMEPCEKSFQLIICFWNELERQRTPTTEEEEFFNIP